MGSRSLPERDFIYLCLEDVCFARFFRCNIMPRATIARYIIQSIIRYVKHNITVMRVSVKISPLMRRNVVGVLRYFDTFTYLLYIRALYFNIFVQSVFQKPGPFVQIINFSEIKRNSIAVIGCGSNSSPSSCSSLCLLPIRLSNASSVEQKNGNSIIKDNKTTTNGVEVNKNEDQNSGFDAKGQAKKKPNVPGGGPLLQQTDISSSQLDFFKMLDEKIESGPDYDESLDTSNQEDRVTSLLRRWELASVNWSSVSDLNNISSPSKQRSRVLSSSRQSLNAKDREGMRNIIGGRPESAPIFIRNANRMDGLQDGHRCPSPNMPRHVLESITQSPTQGIKTTTPVCASPIGVRYVRDGKECSAMTEQQPNKLHYTSQNPMNGEYVTQQALYREQYLQQTGIITVTPQYSTSTSGSGILRSNSYVQHFQIAPKPQHFATTTRERSFNTAQMT